MVKWTGQSKAIQVRKDLTTKPSDKQPKFFQKSTNTVERNVDINEKLTYYNDKGNNKGITITTIC